MTGDATDAARVARPEHFFRAVEHGLSLALAGMKPNLLLCLSRGAAARGLTDAADGYTHAWLRVGSVSQMWAPPPGEPTAAGIPRGQPPAIVITSDQTRTKKGTDHDDHRPRHPYRNHRRGVIGNE